MNKVFHLFGHSFDFTKKLFVYDGFIVRDKTRLVGIINVTLHLAGYEYHSFLRPVPAFIINYKDMDYRFLCNFFSNVCSQLNSYKDMIGNRLSHDEYQDFLLHCELFSDGFHYMRFDESISIDLGRVIRLTFSSNERGWSYIFTTYSCAGRYIDNFFKMPYTNKKIFIE